MAPKIERVTSAVFGTSAVSQKKPADSDSGSRQQHEQASTGSDSDESAGDPDRESLAKALEEYRASESFRATGMVAELREDPEKPGRFQVIFRQRSGAVVRTLGGQEFLRIAEATKGQESRGRILDQKF